METINDSIQLKRIADALEKIVEILSAKNHHVEREDHQLFRLENSTELTPEEEIFRVIIHAYIEEEELRKEQKLKRKSSNRLSRTSARERQVSVYVAKGHTNAEIAKALFVSPRTVTTHLERIFKSWKSLHGLP